MSMLLVSDEDFEKELESHNFTVEDRADSDSKEFPTAQIQDIQKGRGPNLEVPEEIRKFVSSQAIQKVPAKILSENFGVSQSSVSAYKHDATSTASYHNPDPSLRKSNEGVRERITATAQRKLILALRSITSEKLEAAKPIDASSIARNMAAIVKDMNPEDTNSQTNVQFIIHRPRVRSIEEFSVIDAKED